MSSSLWIFQTRYLTKETGSGLHNFFMGSLEREQNVGGDICPEAERSAGLAVCLAACLPGSQIVLRRRG